MRNKCAVSFAAEKKKAGATGTGLLKEQSGRSVQGTTNCKGRYKNSGAGLELGRIRNEIVARKIGDRRAVPPGDPIERFPGRNGVRDGLHGARGLCRLRRIGFAAGNRSSDVACGRTAPRRQPDGSCRLRCAAHDRNARRCRRYGRGFGYRRPCRCGRLARCRLLRADRTCRVVRGSVAGDQALFRQVAFAAGDPVRAARNGKQKRHADDERKRDWAAERTTAVRGHIHHPCGTSGLASCGRNNAQLAANALSRMR